VVAPFRLLAAALIGALLVAVLVVPAADARTAAVPKVSGLAAGASNAVTAKLSVRWRKVTGATYQVRWASTTKGLTRAHRYAVKTTSAVSPTLSNICITWYAQVRAKKAGRFGAWSVAKALRFSVSTVKVPTPVTAGQTSTTQAQVRWTRSAGAVGYRLHYSPAPFGNWPGYFPYTPFTAPSATGVSVNLPHVATGDRFMGAAYGNPLFAQLEVKKCTGTTYPRSTFFPVFPKALPAGSPTTGNALAFGSYNLELAPTTSTFPTKVVDIANNIATHNLDVVALQEANTQTATSVIAQLALQGQAGWEACTQGQQAVIYRKKDWVLKAAGSCVDVGESVDGDEDVPSDAAKTPLPTPGVTLTPATPDPTRRDIFVASIHLEDRSRFDSTATIPQRKQDAHDAALVLLANIANANATGLPTLVAGDFKGNFGGTAGVPGAGYCDESSTPFCAGEGQPTFIRNGYLDARGAVTKVGIQYPTVSAHVATPVASSSGVGSRADFIVVKGFTGISRYENVIKTYGNASDTYQPDHNLIFANLFIPFAP
jgi:endonuclease/exonuclease/phosphatase family metal-dependent hydrolase